MNYRFFSSIKALIILFTAGTLLCLAMDLRAQNEKEKAVSFLKENVEKLNLSLSDVNDLALSDQYVSKSNGLTHVWLQQQYLGIPVHNALIGLHVQSNGHVLYNTHRFVKDLSTKVNTHLPSLSASTALEMAKINLHFEKLPSPGLLEKINEQQFIFNGGEISKNNIPVSASYQLTENGKVRLAWSVLIDEKNGSDIWSISIDAITGEVLRKNTFTNHCQIPRIKASMSAFGVSDESKSTSNKSGGAQTLSGDSYNVFPLPLEAPNEGNRSIVVDPAMTNASPYAWHDINGVAGAEYTYTRGNNVWAYDDINNDNTGSMAESVDGGVSLYFDFPYNPLNEPELNKQAAIVNLFYMNNMMHDFSYQYGFDEPAGNFQQNNYGQGGLGNDFVNAEALDGGGTDNANFATPADGNSPRMQMYKWATSTENYIYVNTPVNIQGYYYGNVASGWGGTITTTPITGGAVFSEDGIDVVTDACETPTNNLTGKIAFVDRGSCEFGFKALKAQQAGAIACVICDHGNPPLNGSMGAGSNGASVNIPTLLMTKQDCDLLRPFIATGLNLSIAQPVNSGPSNLDGDFDNGIIAHEYAHGISNRLTGGPSQSGCLSNEEQMGEGWSDWFALITTVKPGDLATKKRAIGTYVQGETINGAGIRRYPYSTDMNINPEIFSTVAENTETHALGEVWTTVLWDLYWGFVDKYGYDADINNHNSGNARAIQVVMDGMKLQPCDPGFIDGRDAILLADNIDYNGADTCLIISVFARRGMGLNASQGSNLDAGDGIENFDPRTTCIKELKIVKTTSTPLINPGDTTYFTIKVTNDKDSTLTNVTVQEELPAGLTLVNASNGGTVSGGILTWSLDSMVTHQSYNLSYSAVSDTIHTSISIYKDDMEINTSNFWESDFSQGSGVGLFALQGSSAKTGTYSWFAESQDFEIDVTLKTVIPIAISGTNPSLRFWHNYNTQNKIDAGFLETQISGNVSWTRFITTDFYRQPYNGSASYSTFAIPGLQGFSGNSNGWVQSYYDFNQFNGSDVDLRFRFGSDTTIALPNQGWYVDGLELLDLFYYDGQACVSSDQGDLACAKAPEKGVIVNPAKEHSSIGMEELTSRRLEMHLQPNPANNKVMLTFGQKINGPAQITFISANGIVVKQIFNASTTNGSTYQTDVQSLAPGLYVVRVETNQGTAVKKLMVK